MNTSKLLQEPMQTIASGGELNKAKVAYLSPAKKQSAFLE